MEAEEAGRSERMGCLENLEEIKEFIANDER